MIKKPFITAIVAAGALGGGQVLAEDAVAPTALPAIRVSEPAVASPVQTGTDPSPVTSITKDGLDTLGGAAQTSVYAPLDLVPSVLVQSPDPYGISLSRNISIRGKDDFHITRTLDGLPVTGIVGGDMDMVDLENLQRIDVYRSGLQAGQGLGISNASGAIDSRILGPQDNVGLMVRQAFGENDFYRSFVRGDSGLIKETGTRMFLSGSVENADKWTGVGDMGRKNAMLGIDQTIGEHVRVDLDALYDHYDGNPYRSLTYAQALTPSAYTKYDYNSVLTNSAATNVNYYKFNRLNYDVGAVFGSISISDILGGELVIKPYYSSNTGYQYSASGSNVQYWNQNNTNGGVVAEYKFKPLSLAEVVVGYWYQDTAAPPPPTYQTKYNVAANGNLVFSGWSTLAKVGDFESNSPYLQISKDLPTGTKITGGVRYMSLSAGDMQWYNTAGLPNAGYAQIWAYNPTPLSYGHVSPVTYDAFLPNAGISQKINDVLTLDLSYGRKFGRPDWGPESSQYFSYVSNFTSHNVTLQSLMSSLRPELVDQFDASLRYDDGRLSVTPTAFYSLHRNKEVLVSDPSIGASVAYYTSSGQTEEYGGELEIGYRALDNLNLFASATLSSETFSQNIVGITGLTTLQVKGNQVPNAATEMLTLGAAYNYADLTLTPVAQFVGKRYGDALNQQPVGGYALVDLYGKYDLSRLTGTRNLEAGFAITNIFDRRYIGEIAGPSNLENPGSSTAYYLGAPRTFSGYVSAKF